MGYRLKIIIYTASCWKLSFLNPPGTLATLRFQQTICLALLCFLLILIGLIYYTVTSHRDPTAKLTNLAIAALINHYGDILVYYYL